MPAAHFVQLVLPADPWKVPAAQLVYVKRGRGKGAKKRGKCVVKAHYHVCVKKEKELRGRKKFLPGAFGGTRSAILAIITVFAADRSSLRLILSRCKKGFVLSARAILEEE